MMATQLKAPAVTEGEWTWIFVASAGQWMLIADDLTPVGIGGSPNDGKNPDKKMLATSKKLAEALAAIVNGGLLSCVGAFNVQSCECAYCRSIEALKLSGYTPLNTERDV
jgi:hypothetical protein